MSIKIQELWGVAPKKTCYTLQDTDLCLSWIAITAKQETKVYSTTKYQQAFNIS